MKATLADNVVKRKDVRESVVLGLKKRRKRNLYPEPGHLWASGGALEGGGESGRAGG